MLAIGVIGQGFVGTAVREGFSHALTVHTYDHHVEKGNCPSLEDLVERTDGPIFIAVPTPMRPDGSADTSIVEDVVSRLHLACRGYPGRVAAIKSTVPPGTTLRLGIRYSNIQLTMNPEFLTEAHFLEDFKNQDRIIIGGPPAATAVVREAYRIAYPHVPVFEVSAGEAEMVKYVGNCFLATKVSFANEMKQVCDRLGIDYARVISLATLDKRLGESHWQVPGPMPADDGTGRLLPGFAGSCFIKDINALIYLARVLGVDPTVLDAAWRKNLEVRPQKDWLHLQGRAVVDQAFRS